MKKILLWLGILLIPAPYGYSAAPGRNVDTPVITTLLEQRDGSRIQLSFRAVHWDADRMAALKTDKSSREQFNNTFGSRMGIVDTNVKLKFGPRHQIDPGRYYLGFRVDEPAMAGQDPLWYLILSNDKAIWIILPLTIIRVKESSEFLTYYFTPGITDRDFLFNMRYGDLSTSVRWTILGIPSKTLQTMQDINPAWYLPLPEMDRVPMPGMIDSVTPSLSPATQDSISPRRNAETSSKKKAGSGSLRYLGDLKKTEKDGSSNESEKKENP